MWSFGDTVRTLVTSDSFVDKIVTTIVEYHTLVVLIDQFVTFRGVSSIGFYHVHSGISYRLGVSFLCAFRSLVYYMHHVDIRQTALSFLTECHKEEEAIIAIPEVPPLYGYHGEPILEGGDMRRMQALQQSRVFRLWKGSHHKEVVKWKRLELPDHPIRQFEEPTKQKGERKRGMVEAEKGTQLLPSMCCNVTCSPFAERVSLKEHNHQKVI